MIKKIFLIFIFIIALLTVFIGVQESMFFGSKPLEEICQELSNKDNLEYKVITAELINFRMSSGLNADCFPDVCPEAKIKTFTMLMKSTNSDKTFGVHSKAEMPEYFTGNIPDLKRNKIYSFCATGPHPEVIKPERHYFTINHLDTIREFK